MDRISVIEIISKVHCNIAADQMECGVAGIFRADEL